MPRLISMHEMGLHGVGAAIELMLARRMKVELLECIRPSKDFERSSCLKIHFQGMACRHHMRWSRVIMNEQAIVDLWVGNGTNING